MLPMEKLKWHKLRDHDETFCCTARFIILLGWLARLAADMT
jgi:hypothetical protein